MGSVKKELLLKQVEIIEGVLDILKKKFANDGLEDEINFLTIAKENLKAKA